MTIARLVDRAVVRCGGPDARGFLQGLLTNDVDRLTADRPLYAGLLSPQGKVLFDLLLFADGDDILIDVAADRASALVRRLTMYRLRKAVTIATTGLHVMAGWDGDAGHGPADPRLPALGSRWIDTSDVVGDDADYAAHRRALGVPDSADIGEDELLWLETNADLLDGVSFTKGCYVGQENTARMHHRDKVRRRLVPLQLAGDPGDATEVVDDQGRRVGAVRNRHGDRALAFLRVEALAGPLRLGDASADAVIPAWLAPVLDAAGQPG